MAQGVEVVPFDDQVLVRRFADAQVGLEVEGDEVGVDGVVAVDFVGLPDEAEARGVAAVARLQEADKLVVGEVVVFCHGAKTGVDQRESMPRSRLLNARLTRGFNWGSIPP